jgi:iron complex outermembrane recepter protein
MKKMNSSGATRLYRLTPIAAASVLALLPPAHAEDAVEAPAAASAPAAAAEHGAPQSLQEVVVTATRHEESLSKVPISVTALTQDAMDSRGIKDFQDIARFTPGVSIDNSGTNAISIRGISSSAGAGTTGIYLDDTPIQMRNLGFNPEDTLPKTFDLERVEVLRGPQGTLFGAGAEGGAVRYILAQPSVTTASTYARSEVSYTEYGQPSYEFGVAHGGPIIDGVLGFRASAWYRYDGGWIDRVDAGTDAVTEHNVNYSRTLMLRVAGLYEPTSSFTVTPSIIYQNRQQHDQDTYWPAYSNPGSGQFNTATPENIPDPDQWYLPALKLQWDFGKAALISNSSYYHRKNYTGYQGTVYDLAFYQSLGWPANPSFGIPVGGSGIGCEATNNAANCPWYPLIDGSGIHMPPGFANYATPNVMTNTQQSYTQEIRLQSTDDASRLHWTVGAFWQLAKEGSIENLIDPQINSLFNYIYGQDAVSLFGPYYACPSYAGAAYPAIPACSIYYNQNTTFDRQIAGFGELTYEIVTGLKLTVGERVAKTSFNLDHYSDGLENFGPSPAAANEHETSSTPKVSLSWQINNDNMVYATYAKGFRPGGGNAPLPDYCSQGGSASPLAQAGYPNGAPLTYRSDSTQSYEIGSKNNFGAVRIATSLYYIKWNGIQQNVYIGGTCGLQFTDNLGQAVAKGFDLQAELALGASFYMDFSAGYTNARFTQTAYPGGDPSAPPLAVAGDAISGEAAIDYAPGTNPPWTVAIGPEYRFNIHDHDAFIRVDYEYQSRNPWLAAVQDARTSQYFPYTYTLSATHFTSLRGGINFGNFLVTPFIDNLFNTQTVTNYALGQLDPYNPAGSPTPQQNAYTFRPRTFGITATWNSKGG